MLSHKSELFVEIPEEQQEIVSGGDTSVISGSSYTELASLFAATSAGEDGASTVSITEVFKNAEAILSIFSS